MPKDSSIMQILPTGWFYIFAGPNGAGKSEAKKRFWNPDIQYINPDEFKTPISEVASSRASKQMIGLFRDKGRQSFGFETTLAAKKPNGIISWASSYNYKVSLVYIISASLDDCIRNVHHRVDNGGHDVPDDTIRTRYKSSINNFLVISGLVDEWHLLFNDGQNYTLVAQSVNGKSEYVAPYIVSRLPQELQSALPKLISSMCH